MLADHGTSTFGTGDEHELDQLGTVSKTRAARHQKFVGPTGCVMAINTAGMAWEAPEDLHAADLEAQGRLCSCRVFPPAREQRPNVRQRLPSVVTPTEGHSAI